jgi:hypothetical protein
MLREQTETRCEASIIARGQGTLQGLSSVIQNADFSSPWPYEACQTR